MVVKVMIIVMVVCQQVQLVIRLNVAQLVVMLPI